MLAATKVPYYPDELAHHLDGGSFRKALDTRCAICIQFWIKLNQPDDLQSTTWSLTQTRPHLLLRSSHDNPCAFSYKPWLTERACTDTQDLGTEAPGTCVSDSTQSVQSFDFVNSKYQQCTSRHSSCAEVTPRAFLPTRLLDVGHAQFANVILVDREQIPQGSSYVTLSHCWGQVTPLKLTQSFASTLRCGIVDDDLPKTFRDAVMVVRKTKQRYLWIDSL
jgi:hypothetical protein